jgi:hypothetical protein
MEIRQQSSRRRALIDLSAAIAIGVACAVFIWLLMSLSVARAQGAGVAVCLSKEAVYELALADTQGKMDWTAHLQDGDCAVLPPLDRLHFFRVLAEYRDAKGQPGYVSEFLLGRGHLYTILAQLPPVVHTVRDDGRYANSPLKAWFDKLASGKGLCCSFADGFSIKDVDWDTHQRADGSVGYRVRLDGEWTDVPDSAVVAEPNRFGAAVVWPIGKPGAYSRDEHGVIQIRCFMPGAGA